MNRKKELCLAFNPDKNLASKKGQVAIFIVVAIVLVATVLLIFLFWKEPNIDRPSPLSPATYIDSCVKESAKKAIPILSENGGSIEPKSSISYSGQKFAYLCYNANYYDSCVNQQPMLIEHIEQSVTDYIEPEVKDCFSRLKAELEGKGYEVSIGQLKIETTLEPNRMVITSKRKMTISGEEETQNFDEFETRFTTPLYDLSEIATEIVNQEAAYCDFDTLSFMLMHPEYDVRKKVIEDSNLYTLKILETGEEFKFAVRGCVMPPGI